MSGFVRLFSLPVRCAIAVLAAAVMMVIFVGSRGGITHAQGTPAFTVLHSFSSGQGAFPIGLLPMPSGVLYGAATGGGCANCSGTVFKLVGSSSSTYTAYVLHTFGGDRTGTSRRADWWGITTATCTERRWRAVAQRRAPAGAEWSTA